jgi:hypothetical protein
MFSSKTQREAVVSSLVFVHQSVHNAMQQVCVRSCAHALHWLVAELCVCVLACLQLARARQGRSAYVTPRHYLVSSHSALLHRTCPWSMILCNLMIHPNPSECG